MIKVYIVAEGKSDIELLKKVLPKNLTRFVEFVAGGSGSSSLSLASTILAVRRQPVALIRDADTQNESAIEEKISLLRELLRNTTSGVPYEVFIAKPEIEAILFQDKSLIERITKKKLSASEWQYAELRPKQFLIDFLIKNDVLNDDSSVYAKIFEHFSKNTPEILRKHPLITDLIEFIHLSQDNQFSEVDVHYVKTLRHNHKLAA